METLIDECLKKYGLDVDPEDIYIELHEEPLLKDLSFSEVIKVIEERKKIMLKSKEPKLEGGVLAKKWIYLIITAVILTVIAVIVIVIVVSKKENDDENNFKTK